MLAGHGMISVQLGATEDSRLELQRFDDGVVHQRAYLLDGLRAAIGPGAVGEQRDTKLPIGIDPQRGAGVTEVSKGPRRKMCAGRRWRGWCVPTEGPRRADGCWLTPSKEFDCGRSQDR